MVSLFILFKILIEFLCGGETCCHLIFYDNHIGIKAPCANIIKIMKDDYNNSYLYEN